MKKYLIIFIFPIVCFANTKDSYHCFPESDLKIPVKKENPGSSLFKNFAMAPTSGLSQLEFEHVIKKFSDFWSPIIMNKYQKKLKFENNWSEERINASATRDFDDNPIIRVSGGLARHPDITKNGMLMILCHELGHQFGGAPKSFRGRSTKRSWSSAEGQADYYATTKCMARMALSNALYPEHVKIGTSQCKNDLCLKIAPAALSVGNLFASLKSDWERPSLNEKSPFAVRSTFYRHPSPQCRLDTFVAGSLCTEDFDKDFDNFDHTVGSCTKDQDPEAARPKCWFSHEKY